MFVYVIDTTIMNVSISNVVDDLDTTVSRVQAAITFYTLTMAAFMLTGGKLGDIWGSRRAFRIGLVIYGTGTTMTALAPNIWFLLLGWSVLEGLGSALIVPAINTLVRTNYSESKRASAYGTLWGVAAAGAAFGPIVGGWLTTNLSWRVAFAVEALIVVVVLLGSRLLQDSPAVDPRPRLDRVGVVLSAVALAALVWGILQTSSRGWDDPIVLTAIFSGIVMLGVFLLWVRRQTSRGEPALVHLSIFRHRSLNAGLPILSIQTFVQAGVLFLVPLYAQFALGLSAFDTGLALLPLSISVLVVSSLSPPPGSRHLPAQYHRHRLRAAWSRRLVALQRYRGGDQGIGLRWTSPDPRHSNWANCRAASQSDPEWRGSRGSVRSRRPSGDLPEPGHEPWHGNRWLYHRCRRYGSVQLQG